MRIEPIITTTAQPQTRQKQNAVSFKTYNPEAAARIEREIMQKGIFCNTKGNDFVASCFKKTVELFERLFGQSHLPERLDYEELGKYSIYGVYTPVDNSVTLNQQRNSGCYYDMDSLKAESEKAYHFLSPDRFSTTHPAHTFVHEFSHAAHWHHLENRNGGENAKRVWLGLGETTVPTAIGKLITRFKLGNYAVDRKDMCEFLAERMTKDICGSITDEMWVPYKDIDVDYSNIFSKKWNYRYSSPQSYIDYFTQQVWDGDIDEANRAGDMAEAYLAELEGTKRIPDTVEIAGQVMETALPFGGSIARGLGRLFGKMTDYLDEKNRLNLNK